MPYDDITGMDIRPATSAHTVGVNHYATLGVSPNASKEEIHQAWRRLSKRYRPYQGMDTSDSLMTVNMAYNTLKDPEKKARYDMTMNPGMRGSDLPEGFYGDDMESTAYNVGMGRDFDTSDGDGFKSNDHLSGCICPSCAGFGGTGDHDPNCPCPKCKMGDMGDMGMDKMDFGDIGMGGDFNDDMAELRDEIDRYRDDQRYERSMTSMDKGMEYRGMGREPGYMMRGGRGRMRY